MMQGSQSNPFAGVPGQTPVQPAPLPAAPVQQFNPLGEPQQKSGGKGKLILLVLIVLILIGAGAFYYLSQTGTLPANPTPTPTVTPTIDPNASGTPTPSLTPTATVDPAAPAIEFKSTILDLAMTFPGRFGSILKDKQSSTTGVVCDVETVGFSHVRLQGSFVKGDLSCISTFGGEDKEKYILTTKDGKKLEVTVKDQNVEEGTVTILGTFRGDKIGINIGVSDIKTADLTAAKKDLEDVVKTLTLKI